MSARTKWLALVGVLGLGAFINAPALRGPFVLDDVIQQVMAEGRVTPRRNPLNLYDFVSDSNREALLTRGAMPWSADAKLVLRFLRPIPSLIVWLDYRLFSDRPLIPHVISFIVWVAALLCAHALYSELVPARAALVATTVFALVPAHAIPLLWLANSNVLFTVALGTLALRAYVVWRRMPTRRNALSCAMLFGALTLTGEYALSFCGYLLTFELSQKHESLRRRAMGLLPALVPIAAYSIAYLVLGYGAQNSGLYRDPIRSPISYLTSLPQRFTTLAMGVWLGDDISLRERTGWPTVIGAAVVIGVLAVSLRASRRRIGHLQQVGWLVAGSVFALLPIVSTGPSSRTLGVVSIGAAAGLGILIESPLRLAAGTSSRALTALDVFAALALSYIHVWDVPYRTRQFLARALRDENRVVARFAPLKERISSDAIVIVTRASTPPTVLGGPFNLRPSIPRHWWVLSQTGEMVTIVRTSANAIDVSSDHGPLIDIEVADIFRATAVPFGQTIFVPGLRATVLRADATGQPTVIRYEFDVNLDAPIVTWISESTRGYSEVTPPPIGFGVHIAP